MSILRICAFSCVIGLWTGLTWAGVDFLFAATATVPHYWDVFMAAANGSFLALLLNRGATQ